MIEKLALNMAVKIKRNIPDHTASVSVLKYSLAIILNTAFIIIGSLIISLFTGKTTNVLILLVAFALLRQVSGGIHLKSGTACAVVTTAVFTVLSFFDANLFYTQIINSISFVLVLTYAPSRIREQYKLPKRYYPLLKVIAALFIIGSFIIHSPTLAICFLVQSLTLISRREVNSL